ncbi:Exosome complex exonuclease [Lachnellula hyalina]|uniref:Exosome complex exonuclease n=1 Tax=Lachnellula hyalina TaxID=1316788 RepID=A0A8H8U413_9HELO|nr:Exosome complex exonuclease [Lachnellula hyalina]TVY30853.1 Exosome complex exonuclease [Lachnellula hyalina]
MEQTLDFKSLQEQVQASLIATTRTTGQISSEDLAFQRSLNREVGTALDEQSNRLLDLSSQLLKSATSISDLRAPALEELDDVENNWRSVVDVIDSLLEKTDTCLDEYTGMIKRKEQSPADQATSNQKKNTTSLGNAFRNQNLVKPQLAFDIKPDNQDTSPWKPLLTSKPHATVPLEESLGIITNDYDQKQYDYTTFLPLLVLPSPPTSLEGLSKSQQRNRRQSFKKHVDKYKQMGSTMLGQELGNSVYQRAEPIMYQPVDTTEATWVDTEEGVLKMLGDLKGASEIAIDLEHHDSRSYVGLVSLMQISIRGKDWIVDTLKPWRHKLQVLNEVFADPKIIKVFHGAYMDIVWLQRDLGLYVVGLFDTHWASKTLGYQGGSLAFLLKKFIDFDADKKYQLADWRIRPLPQEMFFYARADTHFLLYIYDNMRNELLDRTNPDVPDENRMEMVLQKSKEVSLLRYERQIYNTESGRGPGGWYPLLVKTPALFNNEQFAVFRAIHEWRDQIARADDDSTAFLMPNHVIFSIAKVIPTDQIALLGLARPISHSVKSRAGELLNVIKTAKAKGKDGPSMMDALRHDTTKANVPSLAGKAKTQSPTSVPLVAVVDGDDLRSSSSTFWGGAFGSSIWDESTPTKLGAEIRLAVPLPQLSPNIFQSSNDPFSQQASLPTTTSLPIQPSKAVPKSDEPFVLKRGTKRNSENISVADSDEEGEGEDSDYDISFSSPSDATAIQKAPKNPKTNHPGPLTKKEKKKLIRKERKLEKEKAAASAEASRPTSDAVEDEDEEEPFDYSKAESVLHAKRKNDKGGGEGGKNKKQKPFDPYSKSENAAKGMRRAQTERPGRSHTFKN